jgi:excisionase family DNA binding protein
MPGKLVAEKLVPKKFLKAIEVAQMLGVHKSYIWAMTADGRLPKPVRFGKRYHPMGCR